jgi:uncharacterized protein (DUF4415 family)
MANRLPLTDEEGEVRELDEEDFRAAVPFSALPESLRAKLSALKSRGPQKSPTKDRITIRLSREVLDQFRATGDGWQTRIDGALKEWLKTHPLA